MNDTKMDDTTMTRAARLTEAARLYRDNHHWVPLLLRKGKEPGYYGWTEHTLKDAIPKFSDSDNIGILLGKPSGNLVRLDPDFAVLPGVTAILFPGPTLTFGRPSSPGGGRLVTSDIKSTDFKLPKSMRGHPDLPLHNGEPGLVVFQILSTGDQTMAPPSIHPGSGEELTWRSKIEPASIAAPELLRRVGLEAFLMVVAHFWPARGSRNEAAMALARGLLEAMAARHPNDAERVALVDELVLEVAMEGGDGERSRNGKERAATTLERMHAGEDTIGMPRLLELLELPANVGKTFRKWLGLSARAGLAANDGVSLIGDFVAYLPEHKFIFMPTGALWPASGVDARVPPAGACPASVWLDANARVEQMTWCPGLPTLIKDKLFSADGAWSEKPGCTTFNLYRPPIVEPGDATKAGPWVDLVREVYPNDEEEIMAFLAHRRQHPEDKINHMLVLGGPPGIGKDSIVTSVRAALGPWNVAEVSPSAVTDTWNGFLKSTVVLINELRDLGDSNRVAFYEATKWMLASPPATLRINEKHRQQYYIPNVCGVIATTNHKTDGLYLTADDRRHYVAWSPLEVSHKSKGEWTQYYRWLADGGDRHVAAYLDAVDLTDFDAKAPPKKTDAFWQIVTASTQPEESELSDILAEFEGGAVTLAMVAKKARDKDCTALADFLEDRTRSRVVTARMDKAGYPSVRNQFAKDGRFKVGGRDCVVYCPKDLGDSETQRRVEALIKAKSK